jgi:hypothetical protein
VSANYRHYDEKTVSGGGSKPISGAGAVFTRCARIAARNNCFAGADNSICRSELEHDLPLEHPSRQIFEWFDLNFWNLFLAIF